MTKLRGGKVTYTQKDVVRNLDYYIRKAGILITSKLGEDLFKWGMQRAIELGLSRRVPLDVGVAEAKEIQEQEWIRELDNHIRNITNSTDYGSAESKDSGSLFNYGFV